MTTTARDKPMIGHEEGDGNVSPVLAHMLNRYARTLGPEEAERVLTPLARQVRQSAPHGREEQARHGRMAGNWLINTLYPALLDTVPALKEQARALRNTSPWPQGQQQEEPSLQETASAAAESAFAASQEALQRRQDACNQWNGSHPGRNSVAYRILEQAGHGAAIHALYAAGEVGLLACGSHKLTGAALDALTAAHHEHFTDRWLCQHDPCRQPAAADPSEVCTAMRESVLQLMENMLRPAAKEARAVT